jgi:hypothetical protein
VRNAKRKLIKEKQYMPAKVIKLENVRLSFPDIFQPRKQDDGSKGSYGASLIMAPDHPAVQIIAAEMIALAKEKWPKDHEVNYAAMKETARLCLRGGAGKAKFAGYKGNVYISANNKSPIKVFDSKNRMITSECEEAPYAGCNVNATVELWVQDHPSFGQRINATLRGIQFHSDNEAFGSGSVAEDDEFGAPTEGADADMPQTEATGDVETFL